MTKAHLPQIVLVGRPNVGKSTLFNRLIRSNRAITHDRPGITRDRMEGVVRMNGTPVFGLVDTGGLTLTDHNTLGEGPEGIRGFEQHILEQAEQAMARACAVAMVVDGQAGLLPLDEHLVQHVRRKNLPTICIVNKVDGQEHEDALLADFHSLGIPLCAVSAAHGHNINGLCQELLDLLPQTPKAAGSVAPEMDDAKADGESPENAPDGTAPTDPDTPQEDIENAPLRLAMLGRPNAGKSSLVNALVGEGRMIVSDVAGTTRDSVDVACTIHTQGRRLDCVFVDTAGIRRRTKITDSVEKYSVNAAIKSTTKAQVTLLVLDATAGLGQQDKRLMDMLVTRRTPFLILINKSDLLTRQEVDAFRKELGEALAFCSHVPILAVSAKSGANLKKILPTALKIRTECQIRIPTGQLNRAMEDVLHRHQPPLVRHSRPKFFYLTQAETAPPTFVFFVSDATRVPESYMRYLERGLRKLFGISHAPMRLHLRSSHNKDKGTRDKAGKEKTGQDKTGQDKIAQDKGGKDTASRRKQG